MNGLDLILQKIEEDNALEVSKIKNEGKKTAEKIIADAEVLAKAEAEKIIADGDKKTSVMLENAKNGCEALIKRAEISAKSQVVEECIKLAINELNSMADDKYFEIIKMLILKYYHPDERGELCMNAKDVDRMPKGFLKTVNKELKKSGAELGMADNPANMDSGFVIRYGGVEENCTFSSLIEDKTDIIKDKLYSHLMA